MPEEYKTEEQLKREAKARMEQAAKAPQKPKTEAQKKSENFWYHYKWHTIGITLAVVLAVFLLRDTVFRTRPDLTVVMITGAHFEQHDIERLTYAIEERTEDFNGDGKIVVSIDYMSLPADDDPYGYASQMRMMAVIAAAVDPLYLLDGEAFDMLTAAGEGVPVFEEISAPVSSLGVQGFEEIHFLLRRREAFSKNPDYYSYCESFIEALGPPLI